MIAPSPRALAINAALTPADAFAQAPPGPRALLAARREATVRDGTRTEAGERISSDGPRVRCFEMKLTRVGETDGPAAGAVPRR